MASGSRNGGSELWDGNMSTVANEVIPRSAVQQLANDCERHFNSLSSTMSADVLLNWLESTISIVEEGSNLLSAASSLFSAELSLLSTFHTSLARCLRTLQYGINDCTIYIPSFTTQVLREGR